MNDRPFHWEAIGAEADRGASTSFVKVYDDAPPQIISTESENYQGRHDAADVKHKIEALLAGNGQPARLILIAEPPEGFAFIANRVLTSVLKNSGLTIEGGIELAVGANRVEVSVSHETGKSAIAVVMK